MRDKGRVYEQVSKWYVKLRCTRIEIQSSEPASIAFIESQLQGALTVTRVTSKCLKLQGGEDAQTVELRH